MSEVINWFISSGLGKMIFFLLISTTLGCGLLTAFWVAKRSPWGIVSLLATALCGFFTAFLALFGACPGR